MQVLTSPTSPSPRPAAARAKACKNLGVTRLHMSRACAAEEAAPHATAAVEALAAAAQAGAACMLPDWSKACLRSGLDACTAALDEPEAGAPADLARRADALRAAVARGGARSELAAEALLHIAGGRRGVQGRACTACLHACMPASAAAPTAPALLLPCPPFRQAV